MRQNPGTPPTIPVHPQNWGGDVSGFPSQKNVFQKKIIGFVGRRLPEDYWIRWKTPSCNPWLRTQRPMVGVTLQSRNTLEGSLYSSWYGDPSRLITSEGSRYLMVPPPHGGVHLMVIATSWSFTHSGALPPHGVLHILVFFTSRVTIKDTNSTRPRTFMKKQILAPPKDER